MQDRHDLVLIIVSLIVLVIIELCRHVLLPALQGLNLGP